MGRRSIACLGLLLAACAAGDDGTGGSAEVDGHGYVKVQLGSALDGTKSVSLQLGYSQCLVDFYADHPEWAHEGADGAALFSAFADPGSPADLCAQEDATRPTAACTVREISQALAPTGGMLRVQYDITDALAPDSILFAGPVPCASLTGCTPLLLASGTAGSGYGTGGAKLWGSTAAASSPDAACGQDLPIELGDGG